jgi:hypothetical protein
MKVSLHVVYLLLLSHAFLWLYLSSNSYFLRLLSHITKSYVLRAWLASTLNKNTHREKEERKKLPVLINWLKKHIYSTKGAFMTRISWTIQPCIPTTNCIFLCGKGIKDIYFYILLLKQINHAISCPHTVHNNFVSFFKPFYCQTLNRIPLYRAILSDAIFWPLHIFRLSENQVYCRALWVFVFSGIYLLASHPKITLCVVWFCIV